MKDISLAYGPSAFIQDSACSSEYIYVVESGSRSVHIHSLTGEEVLHLDTQQLGLMEDEEIWQIGSGPGHMHIAAYDFPSLIYTRVITYSISL